VSWGSDSGNVRVVGAIVEIETIAIGREIRDLARLMRTYGAGRWRKLKGIAMVKLPDDTIARAEVHWYQCHGVGRRELKVKRIWEPAR
jgi:hypothetical protein